MRGAAHLAPGPELRVVAALQHCLCAVMGPRRRLVHVLDARSGALERLWRVPSAATCAAGGAEHPLAVGCADGSLWVWAGGGAEEAVAKRQRVDASALVPAHDVCDDPSVGHARVADGVPLAWVALAGPDSPDCFFGLSAAPCEVHLAHLGSTRLLGVLSCPVATMLRVPARGGGGYDVRSRPLLQWLLGDHYTADRACLVMGHTDGSISVALEGMPAHGRRTVVPPSSSPCVHLGLVHLECLQGGDGSEKDANACVAVLRCGTVLVLCAAGVRKYSAGVAVASCTTLSTLVVLVPVASDEPLAPVVLNLEGLGTQLVTLLLGEGEAALSATCVAALDGHVWTLGADGALWRHAVHDGARLPLSLGAYHGLDVAGAVRAIVGTAAQLQHLDEAHRTANVALTELNCALRFMGASEAQLSAEIRAEVAVSGAALLLVTLHNNTAVHMSPRWSANVQLCDRDVVVWECTVALARGIAPGSAVALPVSPSPVPTSRPLLCRVHLVYVPLDWAALAAQRAPAPQDAVRVHVGVQRIGALDWQFRASPGLDRALVPGLQVLCESACRPVPLLIALSLSLCSHHTVRCMESVPTNRALHGCSASRGAARLPSSHWTQSQCSGIAWLWKCATQT